MRMNARWCLLTALVIAALAVIGCAEKKTASEPPATAGEPRGDANATVMYTCSMHPEVRQPEPGDCPKCGMKLVVEKKK